MQQNQQSISKINKLFLKKKFQFISVLVLFFIYFSPYLILGSNAYIQNHDNLDQSNLVGIYDGYFNGVFFASESNKNFTLPTVDQNFKINDLSFDRLLFYIFGYFWGFVINELLYRLIAFLGMVKLLEIFKKKYYFPQLFQILIAFSFASLPFYPQSYLSSAGLPLLICSFHSLLNRKNILSSYFYIFFFAFYSHFFLSGFFVGILISLVFLYLLFKSELNVYAFGGALLLLISFLISHYHIFLNHFYHDIASIRSSYSILKNSKSISAFDSIIQILLKNGTDAPTNHAIIILPSVFVFILEGYKYFKMKAMINFCLILIIFSSLIFGLYHYYPFLKLFNFLASGFNWSRFYWLNPTIWYALWSLLLIEFYNKSIVNNKFLYSAILFSGVIANQDILSLKTQIIIAITAYLLNRLTKKYFYGNESTIFALLIGQILINMYSYTFPAYTRSPSFKQFYSEEQFQEIIEHIKIDKNTSRIGCIGFFPSVANYNGLKTVGSYEVDYPIHFKESFYKVIENELSQNKYLYDYFTQWGKRAYLFDNEIGKPFYDQQYRINRDHPEITCDLNIDALKDFKVEYLFSVSKIINENEKNLKLLHKSIKPDYFYNIYVYKILK